MGRFTGRRRWPRVGRGLGRRRWPRVGALLGGPRWPRAGAFVAILAVVLAGGGAVRAGVGSGAAGRAAESPADGARISSVVEADPGASVPLSTVERSGVAVGAGARAGARAVAHSAAVDPLDVEVVQTSANLVQHLTRMHDLEFQPVPSGGAPVIHVHVIHVNDLVRYQRIGGFGAAMTDSSAWLLHDELSAKVGGTVMNTLFATGGIHLSFVRVPMGASDYTRNGRPYTYDDRPLGRSDPNLSHFSIAHDRAYILPELRQALAINPGAEMLASPWTPPAWMKGNQSLGNVGHHGTLRWVAAFPWARYFVKFIQAYAKAGVPISAVTPQNEPTNPTSYPGLELSEPGEARWIKRDLTPALSGAHLSTKVYGHDWGWSARSTIYAKMLVADRVADRALTGIAWHCYFGSPYLMSTVRRIDTALGQIVDECSPGITPFPTAEVVIGSMRNWAGTVALWNLALDPERGPVQPPNTGCPNCTGLVTIDERTHAARFRLSYFQLGQASAFVQPGATRVESEHYVFYDYQRPGVNLVTPGLDDVAFVNPDGSRVLVAYANSTNPISFAVDWQGRSVSYTLPARAMVTLVWNRPG